MQPGKRNPSGSCAAAGSLPLPEPCREMSREAGDENCPVTALQLNAASALQFMRYNSGEAAMQRDRAGAASLTALQTTNRAFTWQLRFPPFPGDGEQNR